jgi:glycosyltransferase involved in cell wall biosynthesis
MRNPVDFDLIHAHFTWTAGYVGTKLSDSLDVPCAITIHENEDRLTQEIESENDAIQNTWRDADALIRVNKKDCNRLSKYNNSVYYIPNGFSRDRYPVIERAKARAELSISGNKTLIFALTALNSRKNVDMLIEAIGGLEVKEPVYCVIGGRGPERKHLENKINSVETINMIELIGFVPENELYLWMNACDIFTLTSDAEGNPTVMFEALGCGKPYVGTNVGGVDEIIHSSDYGLLCEPGDIKTYRDNLIEAIKRDWNNEKILQYGNKFTWERISRRVADVHVEQLIDE